MAVPGTDIEISYDSKAGLNQNQLIDKLPSKNCYKIKFSFKFEGDAKTAAESSSVLEGNIRDVDAAMRPNFSLYIS